MKKLLTVLLLVIGVCATLNAQQSKSNAYVDGTYAGYHFETTQGEWYHAIQFHNITHDGPGVGTDIDVEITCNGSSMIYTITAFDSAALLYFSMDSPNWHKVTVRFLNVQAPSMVFNAKITGPL